MIGRSVRAGATGIQWVLSLVAAIVFLAGYILSVIAGIWAPDSSAIILTLVIMGLIVGLLNITGREIVPYLVAAIALLVVGNFGAFTPLNDVRTGLGDDINDIVRMMAIFTAPAAVIQAVRAGVVLASPDAEGHEHRGHEH